MLKAYRQKKRDDTAEISSLVLNGQINHIFKEYSNNPNLAKGLAQGIQSLIKEDDPENTEKVLVRVFCASTILSVVLKNKKSFISIASFLEKDSSNSLNVKKMKAILSKFSALHEKKRPVNLPNPQNYFTPKKVVDLLNNSETPNLDFFKLFLTCPDIYKTTKALINVLREAIFIALSDLSSCNEQKVFQNLESLFGSESAHPLPMRVKLALMGHPKIREMIKAIAEKDEYASLTQGVLEVQDHLDKVIAVKSQEDYIKDVVNIHNLPDLDELHLADQGAQITIGDLHGNFIFFLFALIKHGIAKNVTPKAYDRLLQLYSLQTDHLTVDYLEEFKTILWGINFESEATIRLLGDILHDRGSNDYFTLLLLQRLHESRVNVEILLSNHDIGFICAFHNRYLYGSNAFNQSYSNMEFLIKEGLIDEEDIYDIYANDYEPRLKLISYTLDLDANKIMLYSHAPMNFECVRHLAEEFSIEYKDATIFELAKTIEKINKSFNKIKISYGIDSEGFYNHTKASEPDPALNPIEYLLWNRNHDLERPSQVNDYCVEYCHGHAFPSQKGDLPEHVYNLDGVLGKSSSRFVGNYKVAYSHQVQLSQVQQIQEENGYSYWNENCGDPSSKNSLSAGETEDMLLEESVVLG